MSTPVYARHINGFTPVLACGAGCRGILGKLKMTHDLLHLLIMCLSMADYNSGFLAMALGTPITGLRSSDLT